MFYVRLTDKLEHASYELTYYFCVSRSVQWSRLYQRHTSKGKCSIFRKIEVLSSGTAHVTNDTWYKQFTITSVTPLKSNASEWLLLSAKWVIIQQYHDKNKLHCNEMMMMTMMSTLYYTNMLSWIVIVLVHWNNSPQVDMLLHSDTLSWFGAHQY